MAKFEIELDDKGEFVGQLPPEVSEAHKRIGIMAYGNGVQQGQSKALDEHKTALSAALQSERAKWEAQHPLERERFAAIEEENKSLKGQYTNSMRESQKTLQQREEAHAEELTKRVESITKRNARIQRLVVGQLRSLASQSGARDESLPELEVILQHRIGFDDDMEPYVKGEDGKPAVTNTGTPIPMEVFVKQYLDNHPHHRKPVQGAGGGARGGASFHQQGRPATADAARARIEDGDRSPTALNELFEATRKRAS